MRDLLSWIEVHQGLAAWLQALFSVVAILAAAFVASWQAKKQYEASQKLQHREWNFQRTESARTLAAIADVCSNLAGQIESVLDTYQGYLEAVNGETPVELDELKKLETIVAEYPIHSLPAQCAREALILHAELRDFRSFLEEVLGDSGLVDAANHLHWFSEKLTSMRGAIGMSALAIKTVADDMRKSDAIDLSIGLA